MGLKREHFNFADNGIWRTESDADAEAKNLTKIVGNEVTLRQNTWNVVHLTFTAKFCCLYETKAECEYVDSDTLTVKWSKVRLGSPCNRPRRPRG